MRKLVSFMILIIVIVTGGSIMLRRLGVVEGKDIAVTWFLVLVGIIGLLDLIYLIIIPIIKMIKEKDEPPPEFNKRASSSFWDIKK